MNNEVEAMPWPVFQRWWRETWVPGEHVALVGGTGTGKSTLATHLIRPRWWVAALDSKGGDSTLADSGLFLRCSNWPPSKDVQRAIEEQEHPVRIIPGPFADTAQEQAVLAEVQRTFLIDAFATGGWTVVLDEAQVLTDPRMFGLAPEVDRLMIAARSKGVSVVSLYQAPRWVPRTLSQQASYVGLWRTMDRDVVKRMSEVLGRDRLLVEKAVQGLGKHDVIFGTRDLDQPLYLVNYPPVLPKPEPER